MGMKNDPLGGLLAIRAVVVVAIGTVAAVGLSDRGVGAGIGSAQVSAAPSVCSHTHYKDACIRSMSGVSSPSSPEEIFRAAMGATVREVSAALESTQSIGENFSDDYNKQQFIYCEGLFEDSLGLLESVTAEAGGLRGPVRRSDDLRHWLSSVSSLTGGCADVLTDPELRSRVDSAQEDMRRLVSNGVSIVDVFAKAANVNASSTGLGRKLLSDMGVDDVGRPEWLSAGHRKLLAAERGRGRLTPDLVVAKDGSGDFTSINDAVKAAKPKSVRTVIYVKAGVYNEQVIIPKKKTNIYMYGDGGTRTVVTGSKSQAKDGISIAYNPTFAIEGTGTVLRSMGFENTAGPEGEQAVALRVKADLVVVVDCHISAYQDTLYVHAGRQYFQGCVVSGTIDFIFGDAAAVLQNCTVLLRKGGPRQKNMVMAQGRQIPDGATGIVLHDCRILPHKDLVADRLSVPSYLGRPWKKYSRTAVMESTIGDVIRPEGYHAWRGESFLGTLRYGEYANEGAGADTSRRVRWPGVRTIGRPEAMTYTVGKFINGGSWIKGSGADYMLGLKS